MAFFHSSSRPSEPVLRAPAVVLWLIAALVAAHLPQYLVSEDTWNSVLFGYAFIPARYSHEYLVSHGVSAGTWFEQALPFVSYIFIHAGFGHLIVNSLWLLAFGPIVARRFGPILFLLFFLVCGIAGAAAHLATNWGSIAPAIGASGAVSGLMGAAMRMLRVPGSFSFGNEVPLAPLLSRQVLTFTLIWSALNVIAGLIGLGPDSGPHLIAWQAHMGGFAAGLLLASPFDRLARRRGKAMVA